MDKSTKLETIFDRVHLVDTRFEVVKRDAEIAALRAQAEALARGDAAAAAQAVAGLPARLREIEDDRAFLRRANVGGEAMKDADVARVQAILRRADESGARADTADDADDVVLHVGDIEVDVAGRRVRRDGETVHLTPTEFDLLVFLARRPGVVRTREQLLAEVWGYRDGSGARTVDSHVRAIRRKLGNDVIRTVHAVGYSVEDGGA